MHIWNRKSESKKRLNVANLHSIIFGQKADTYMRKFTLAFAIFGFVLHLFFIVLISPQPITQAWFVEASRLLGCVVFPT